MSKKISELTSATTPLTGTEVVPVLQGGANKKTTAQAIANLSGVGGAQVANRVFAGPTAGAAAPAAFRALVAADIPALPAPALPATQIAFGGAGGLMTSDSGIIYAPGIEFKALISGLGFQTNGIISAVGDITNANDGSIFIVDFGQAYYDNIAHTGKFGINTPIPSVALDVVGTAYISQVIKLAPTAFASLPAIPIVGMLAHISNSNTNTWGATIAGGGAFTVLAFYNGTNWTVMGK